VMKESPTWTFSVLTKMVKVFLIFGLVTVASNEEAV
jgi:hypothetical protein